MSLPLLLTCLLFNFGQGLPQGNPIAWVIVEAGDGLPAEPVEGLPAGPNEGLPAGVVDTMTAEDMRNAFPPRDPADIQNWYGTSFFGFKAPRDSIKINNRRYRTSSQIWQPSEKVRDLFIKFTFGTGPHKGKKSIWTKVYGPRLAKILARFQPWRKDQPVGYFIQRSDDSYTMFILAVYVQRKFGYYPYIPMIYDQPNDMPLVPLRDRNDQPGLDGLVGFEHNDTEPAVFLEFTQNGDGICPSLYEGGSGEDVEIGTPHDKPTYPDWYWEQYNGWINEIEGFLDQGGNITAS